MVGGDNGSDGNVLKSKGDGTMEWGSAITPPTFSSIDYPGNDTALDPAGGQNLIINGGNFVTGVTCTIGGTTPSSITLNSASQMTVVVPAKSAGSYALVISNPDGGSATSANAVSYNGVPAFTNAAGSLGNVEEGATVSLSAAATEPDGGAVNHVITSGSLPSGLSINASTGAITGTAPSVSADTTSNFTVTATDNENQSTARAYSITVTNIAPSDNFNAVTYTGNGSSQTITVGFQPDLVWIKPRTDGYDHNLLDSSRGDWILTTNKTVVQEVGNSGVVITNNGFTVDESAAGTTDQEVNKSNSTYVAWCFKASGGTTSTGSGTGGITNITTQVNNVLGFSIIKFTEGTGTNSTVNHGLSSTPDLVISKRITGNNQGWFVHHKDLSGSQYLFLNTDAAPASSASVWNGTAPDSTKITLGPWQTETDDYGAQNRIIYAFTSVTGFSKIGEYTAVSGDNFIETGFKPKFLMIKCISHGSTNWEILDSARSPGLLSNGSAVRLRANNNSTDGGFNNTPVSFLANGFKINKSVTANSYGDYDTTGRTFMYMAFADDPAPTTPTLADSFNAKTYTGNGGTQSITGTGFTPDMVWLKNRTTTASHLLHDSVRGVGSSKSLHPNHTPAEGQLSSYGWIDSFDTNGFTVNASSNGHHSNRSGDSYVAWIWKSGGSVPTYNTTGSINSIVSTNSNAGFSIVQYVGDGVNGRTVGHGLSSEPEVIIIKSRSSASFWAVYHKYNTGSSGNPETEYVRINSTNATATTSVYWGNTAPTSSVFSIGTDTDVNKSNDTNIAYCWHSVSGYSKIGSYTGGGNTNPTINVGFKPDFLMVKKATGTVTGSDGWTIVDSARHPGTPPYDNGNVLYANDDLTEQDDNDIRGFTITSTGFSPNGNYSVTNNSGDTYIYMAFKIN